MRHVISNFSKKCTLRRDGTCPGGTVVSAKCADRSAFGENPYACTALQELAALSSFLQNEAPWNDHQANAAYCPTGSLYVECATVGRVQLPTLVGGTSQGLAGRNGRRHVCGCRRPRRPPQQTSPGPGPEGPEGVGGLGGSRRAGGGAGVKGHNGS